MISTAEGIFSLIGKRGDGVGVDCSRVLPGASAVGSPWVERPVADGWAIGAEVEGASCEVVATCAECSELLRMNKNQMAPVARRIRIMAGKRRDRDCLDDDLMPGPLFEREVKATLGNGINILKNAVKVTRHLWMKGYGGLTKRGECYSVVLSLFLLDSPW